MIKLNFKTALSLAIAVIFCVCVMTVAVYAEDTQTCQHYYDDCLDATCNNEECDFVRENTGHSFSDTYESDHDTHWRRCQNSGCDFIETSEGHKYVYKKLDESSHSMNCSVCDYSTSDLHNGGTATCQSKAKCQFCEGEYGEKASHVATGDWKHDETNHWRMCSTCNKPEASKNAHVFGEWKVLKAPTVASLGSREKTCDCGYSVIEAMDINGQAVTEKPDGGNGGTMALIAVGAVLGAGLISGGLVWLGIKMKKKEEK